MKSHFVMSTKFTAFPMGTTGLKLRVATSIVTSVSVSLSGCQTFGQNAYITNYGGSIGNTVSVIDTSN